MGAAQLRRRNKVLTTRYRRSTTVSLVQARLLPYMEQANLQDMLDFTQPAFMGAYNAQVPNPLFVQAFATTLSVMICPSDPAPKQQVGNGGFLYGGNNYMVSTGSGTVDKLRINRWPTDGIVYENSKVRWADLTDGLSYTVVMSRVHSKYGTGYDSGGGNDPARIPLF